MKRISFEITIAFNPKEENADSSIRCKFDPDSNEIDESELQCEKHDFYKCATRNGTTIELIDPKYRTIQ
jgi:hypothetical protein